MANFGGKFNLSLNVRLKLNETTNSDSIMTIFQKVQLLEHY